MQRNFDVIIVGAGPAGTVLAQELAKKDISVVLLKKRACQDTSVAPVACRSEQLNC